MAGDCDNDHSTKTLALVEEYYDRLAPTYDKATAKFAWSPPAEAASLLAPHLVPGLSVLVAGIGTGQSAKIFQQHGCAVCGIDLSRRMLDLAARNYPQFELHHVSVEQSPEVLNRRLFDIVSAVGFLEFVPDIQRCLRILCAYLKPNGLLCLTFEEYLPHHPIQKVRCSKTGKDEIGSQFSTRRYTLNEIRAWLANFSMIIRSNKRFQAYVKGDNFIYYRILLARKRIGEVSPYGGRTSE